MFVRIMCACVCKKFERMQVGVGVAQCDARAVNHYFDPVIFKLLIWRVFWWILVSFFVLNILSLSLR